MPRLHSSLVSLLFCLPVCLAVGCGGSDEDEPDRVILRPTTAEKPESKEPSPSGSPDESVSSAGVGTLRGVIKFAGVPPELPPFVKKGGPTKEPYCAGWTIPDDSLIVGEDGGLANVFVYLRKAPKGASVPEIPSEPVVFDQEHCQFHPHALVVRAGQTLKIKSSDPINHNTNINPRRNTRFNQSISDKKIEGVDYVYNKTEYVPVLVKCDIHSWMSAWHLPLEHPYAAVTNADGSFEIPNLPAGEHEFRIWHEKSNDSYLDRSYKVTIEPDDITKVSISYPADRFKS